MSTLLINASLIGGACRKEILIALEKNCIKNHVFRYDLYQTRSITHIEIIKVDTYGEVDHPGDAITWLDRWIPDPFSLALLLSMRNIGFIDPSTIENEIDLLRLKLDLPITTNGLINSLARMSHVESGLKNPIAFHGVQTAKIKRRPMSMESLARFLSGKRYIAPTIGSHKKKNQTQNLSLIHI